MQQRSKPRVKIEFTDGTGSAYTISIDGPARENMTKILDFVDSLSQQSPPDPLNETVDTNFARLYGIIQNRFRFAGFTSADMLEAYQEEIGVPTTLSIMSTYLSRLWNRGYLQRTRTGAGWSYRLVKPDLQPMHNNSITP